MLYTVECNYTDPDSEQEWNAFYSQEKLPALISVTGFRSSQRFKALKPGGPRYLAIHTVTYAEVLTREEYRLKGGGNFSRWQNHITDWYRNLYECEGRAPAVASDEILLLSTQPLSFIEGLGYPALQMQASGLDKMPARRFAWVLTREIVAQLADIPGADLYAPLTPQLTNPAQA
ncbi:TPA: sugar ABC transporter [Raoultella planticola]|uniref:sugar ABC transporter n=1 Tax=Raoultella planticola TaxID=575 RepID=UPI001A247C69|nr:sugar ABC transporter [Raoultella planticola]